MESISKQEQASKDFYLWESRHRGYELYSYPISLHVPYARFQRTVTSFVSDDGVVPSVFQKIKTFLEKPKEEEIDIVEYPISKAIQREKNVRVIVISFPKGQDIDVRLSRELLSTLSFTKHPLSFEIIGAGEYIQVQLTCDEYDYERVYSHFQAYFPSVILRDGKQFDIPFDSSEDGEEIVIVDFGLQQEFMLPLQRCESFTHDPLTSFFALLETLKDGDTIVFQILVQGIDTPLSHDVMYAVHDGAGSSFFSDFPEIVQEAKMKTDSALMSVVIRCAVQGTTRSQTEYLANECIKNICTQTTGEYNNLIPLSNEGYDYIEHINNVYYRSTNRTGMILSVDELVSFLHYPNKSIVSYKLSGGFEKTKEVTIPFQNNKYVFGINSHNGIDVEVSINDKEKLEHTHILGATGVGKSTLIANLMLNDIELGNGCALFDPHGDIVDDVLLRIPKHRKDDVIIIDPSDTDFPVGFNLLHANTESEKLVLSSDLVSAFKEHSSAWGDTMTSVLSNVIDTFLDSNTGGTLIELKRFLIEDSFRKEFLKNVSDVSLQYYWEHEYGMVKKRISPLLTRIDTFLRPKIIRSMFVQKDGVDFHKAIEKKKIILFKLSIGLIGEENAYLLGSLFLSKLNQVALGRQILDKEKRHPYYLFLDECHHFIMSPSINSMLSGVRKYGFGLTLAHQDLAQITDSKTLGALLSNPFTRVCFRLGDADAKKLESSFSFFEQADLQSLNRGETIMRFGSATDDYNVKTFPLTSNINEEQKDYIITESRNKYARHKDEIDKILDTQYSKNIYKEVKQKPSVKEQASITPQEQIKDSLEVLSTKKGTVSTETKKEFLERAERQEYLRDHRKVQSDIKKLGQSFGFVSVIEKEITEGKRIDVSLTRDDLKIACEISVTNTVSYEVMNIEKCIEAKYDLILVVSNNKKHLSDIKKKASLSIPKEVLSSVLFIESSEVKQILESCIPKEKPKTEVIKGFRVKTEFSGDTKNEASRFRKDIERILKKQKNRK